MITVRNIEDGNEFKFQNKCLDVVFETFIRKEYKNIGYAENKTLIDVGANVGDTAIYFANKGYTVYAFEPLPNVCDIALKNISLNPQIKDKIKFINKACSCKNGFITLNYDDEETSVFTSEFIKAKKTIEDYRKEVNEESRNITAGVLSAGKIWHRNTRTERD